MFFPEIGAPLRHLRMILPLCASLACAQQPVENPPTAPTASPLEETIKPTFETQKQARTYLLDIPAPRGQITDRNGVPLAQNKLSYNLTIDFPTPLNLSDARALEFARTRIKIAERALARSLKIPDAAILRHYHNRGFLPLEIAQDLSEAERTKLPARLSSGLSLKPLYIRFYPNESVAGQIVGYTGKTGRNADGIIQNGQVLWPETEGREGLEQTFNSMLTGRHGKYKVTFDRDGRKTSERIVEPPVPGYNVVTTLDLHLQEMAEKALAAKAKRGAIVIMDPNNGDILALASWPTFDPNEFIPSISAAKFQELQNDPDIPLLPRAYRSAYPPGSTFKIAVGLAAFQSGTITTDDQYECVPEMNVGNTLFHNWKHKDRGSLNFVQALTESCDTWFYQVGIRTGAGPILDWATRLGFGAKSGIPLKGEAEGRLPNDAYMKATHGRKILGGDIANLSIGQGDLLVTPLQMAQAMAIVANGGTLYQTRLVEQVQTVSNEIVAAYSVREKRTIDASALTMKQIHTAMVDAVNAGAGTAHQASLDKVSVAGKTGTAQWGPKEKERTAAWFAGFVPADHPQYAFAALYEGEVGSKVHGGSAAAPMIGKILRQLYNEKGEEEKPVKAEKAEPEETDESD
ncbi:MAG TPA: penicillin-binding protein 2 [Chthoniobacterales bacterium]|nr:penicillin-binding protein 2 [Chthoniobacterales bacterium]